MEKILDKKEITTKEISKEMDVMPKKDNFKTFYALSIAWQLGFFIAIPIGGFLFLGLLGDKFFKTQPFLLLLGLVVGIIVTAYEGYHLFIPLIKDKEKND